MLVGNFLLWGESVPRVFANKKRPSLTNFPEIWGLSRLEPTDLPTGQCALPESFPGTEPSLPPTGQRAHLTSYVAIEPSLPIYVHQLVSAPFLAPTFGTEPTSVNWSPRTSWTLRSHRTFAPHFGPSTGRRAHLTSRAAIEPSLPPTGQCASLNPTFGTNPWLPPIRPTSVNWSMGALVGSFFELHVHCLSQPSTLPQKCG